MPYIREAARRSMQVPYTADEGELAYLIARAAEERLWQSCDYDWANLTYTKLATIIGVLETAKAEITRRIVVPYEEGKCAENGDCFTYPALAVDPGGQPDVGGGRVHGGRGDRGGGRGQR